jgi:glycosyltransferase involved in cell wall biosynthesis
MSAPPVISVIVATYNRSGGLRRMLESLRAAIPPTRPWELCVVNNNSGDDTVAVLQEFGRSGTLPLRTLVEPRQGQSFACNAAIRVSRGSVLAFTDDDLLVDTRWLVNLERAIDRQPDIIGFAGRAIAMWESPRPRWFIRDEPLRSCQLGVLAYDLGEQPFVLQPGLGPAPVGANMAYRRVAFERFGLLREDMGPPPQVFPGADTEFSYRVRAHGERIVYVPDAIVRHPVDPRRLRRRYALAWAYQIGRGRVRWHRRAEGVREVAGVPLYLYRLLAGDLASLAAGMVTASPPDRFKRLIEVAMRLGSIREHRGTPRSFDPTPFIPRLETRSPTTPGVAVGR